jgi:hypothetical protein
LIVQKATQEKALITATLVPPEGGAANARRRRCLIAQKGTQEKDPRGDKKVPLKVVKTKKKLKLNRKSKTKKLNLRTLWGRAMKTWKKLPGLGYNAIRNMYEGDDLFYNQTHTNDWSQIEGGCITST